MLDWIAKGVSQWKIAVQFGVAKSTVGKIKTGAQYWRLWKKTVAIKGKENYEQIMGMLMV